MNVYKIIVIIVHVTFIRKLLAQYTTPQANLLL